ncbi:MAG: bifunctional hydroxymethylpyrimidine kinase/phosphomethylpyrimidine kinase [Candidatus Contendobacter sp.]|jgi:hydroxymethylpyrimidine/phosphomethylpyrimidine kinase|nr:bifunctional hydroxymethylpyrimidine kinase/phosphomethylpyrimidine kinase [Candidatus Contendobacter sp.]
MNGRVLIVAGSDSGGGAGIQADLKTVTALGGYAATAITALTAQNTRGVFGIVGVEPVFIAQQMRVVLEDLGADCIKTGMLHNAAVIAAVVEALDPAAAGIPVVVDPVMYAKGGDSLLDPAARDTLIQRLLPCAALITPNLREAEALSGLTIRTPADLATAGRRLLELGPAAALIKGGHLAGDTVTDWLGWRGGEEVFTAPRLASRNTHGSGCTLASAIAVGLAQGLALNAAVRRALAYVREAIRTAPGLGQGRGPLNHGHTMRPWGC